jgi:PAS domain S-box-containing protein
LARLYRFYLPLLAETRHNSCVQIGKFPRRAVDSAEASEMAMSLHEDKRLPFDISERQRAEDVLRRHAERQAMLLEVTSDLIRASEPGELGRKTFEHVRSAFGAVVCTNYRFDPAAQRLRLVFVHGIPPERLEAAQSLELGQEYCGTAAASCQPLVADRRRIASDPNGGLVRELGAAAYACYPLKASDGRLLGTFAVASATRESFTDDEVAWLGTITNFLAQAWERFEAEESLRVNEERLRLSQEAAGLGHWDYDYASGTLVWSEQTRKLLGVEPGEPASRALLRSRVHPEDHPRLEEHIARSARLDSDHIRHFEFRVVMQNGAVRWLEDQDRVETNAAGMPVRAVGVLRNITARKSAEEAQARLAAIVTSSVDAIVGKTLDGIVTSWNEAAERMFGYPASEMIGHSIRRLIPADRQSEEDVILGCLARGERVERYETVRVAKDGRTIDVSVTVSPMRDTEGRVIGASKIVRDITARKQAERLLRRQADLLDQSHDAIFTWKIGGGITYWSRGAELLYGYTAEEAIGRSSHELLRTLSSVPIHKIEAQIAGEGSWYGELTHTTREGRTIVVESRHVRVSYHGETYALETNRDITARKQAQEALRKSEERFKSSLVHSPLPILLFDDREQILAISQSWLEQTGYSREELRRIEDWTARAYGECSGEVLEQIRQNIPAEPEAERTERMIRTKDGRDRLWSLVTSALGTQSDGRRLFVCVAQDVTERKAHEEQVHLLMREANHRAKNMLGLVQAIARQTAAREPEDFVERFTERIQALAANQDLLVRNEWQGVDVEDLVRAQLAHFADLIGSRIPIQGPKLRLNAAAAQAIGLALHELATNAGKYGALSTNIGRVDVCWGTDGDTLTMSWTERDGPPVSPPERRGFGSTVIASMAKRTVDGEVELDYAPSGLVWSLTCPAANALEPREREQISGEEENRTNVASGKVEMRTTV